MWKFCAYTKNQVRPSDLYHYLLGLFFSRLFFQNAHSIVHYDLSNSCISSGVRTLISGVFLAPTIPTSELFLSTITGHMPGDSAIVAVPSSSCSSHIHGLSCTVICSAELIAWIVCLGIVRWSRARGST